MKAGCFTSGRTTLYQRCRKNIMVEKKCFNPCIFMRGLQHTWKLIFCRRQSLARKIGFFKVFYISSQGQPFPTFAQYSLCHALLYLGTISICQKGFEGQPKGLHLGFLLHQSFCFCDYRDCSSSDYVTLVPFLHLKCIKCIKRQT